MKYQPPWGVSDPDAPYVNGDPSIARQGSILPAGAAEYPQREIVHIIEKNNIAPNDADLFQMTRAVRSGWINFCIDTGSVNNISVALDPPLSNYRQGLPLRVLIKNNNTGPTVINVNGVGNRPVTQVNGAQLDANMLKTGMIALLVDDGTKFQLVNFQGGAGASNNFFYDIPYAEDTGTVNNIVGVYPGIYEAGQPVPVSGDLVLIKVKNKNTAAVMFKINALNPVPIVRNDGQPLQAYDIELNEIMLLVYNVDRWQVLRLVRSQVLFKLNANLTLYVRTDGNDETGDGSENTAAKAFKTVQRAIDYTKFSFAIAGRFVTIQLGIPGAYIGFAWVRNLPGALIIRGDPNAPLNYALQNNVSSGSAQVVDVTGAGGDVTIQGLTLHNVNVNSHWCACNYNAFLTIDNCAFTGVNGTQAYIATTGGVVILLNNIRFYQHIGDCLRATEGGAIISGAWYTNFYMNGIAFANCFCWANVNATISLYYGYVNITGISYGYRYFSTNNSVVYTAAGGAQWLPGTAPGIADASSVYT